MRRFTTLCAILTSILLFLGVNLAQAATSSAKPPGPRSIIKLVPRSNASGGTVPVAGGRAGVPAHGRSAVALKAAAFRAFRTALRKPGAFRQGTRHATRRSGSAHGTFTQLVGSASQAPGHAYWNGSRWVEPAGAKPVKSVPRLLIPRQPSGTGGAKSSFPQNLYSSTQVDSPTSGCSNPYPNEASVAQSSANPNLVVVA